MSWAPLHLVQTLGIGIFHHLAPELCQSKKKKKKSSFSKFPPLRNEVKFKFMLSYNERRGSGVLLEGQTQSRIGVNQQSVPVRDNLLVGRIYLIKFDKIEL